MTKKIDCLNIYKKYLNIIYNISLNIYKKTIMFNNQK